MGEMVVYFILVDFVFIGGSLLLFGGQNLIEVVVCLCLVLVGLYIFNFFQVIEDVIVVGVVWCIDSLLVFGVVVDCLFQDKIELLVMCQVVIYFVQVYQGVVQWMFGFIVQWFD